MKQLLSALIFIFISASVFAQTDDNEIFIEQTGDTLTLFIEQEGEGNKIGLDDFSTTSSTMAITGTNLSFDIDQIGNNNLLFGGVTSSSSQYNLLFTGDSNSFDWSIGALGGAESTTFDVDFTGSTNTVDFDQGSVADGDRLDLDLILLGSSNVFNIDVESTDAIWNFDISGSYADINTEQSDGVDHKIDFILDGDNADIDIIQTNGTCPVALSCSGIIYMDVTSDNATITILQED
jgi:hypothetical protein|tara:strand:- start:2314 stop:3021 length:708 start_codon:yes stop_codon:yes gene_type:complete